MEHVHVNYGVKASEDVKILVCSLRASDLEALEKSEQDDKGLDISKSSSGESAAGVFFPGPRNTYIPEIKWLEDTNRGCAYCTKIPNEKEAAELVWLENMIPATFLCADCAEDNDILEIANMNIGSRQ